MGKKIESIEEMRRLGLPVPGCIFIFENEDIRPKLIEYFQTIGSNNCLYTIRTDRNDNSMSLKRKLTATKEEIIDLTNLWHKDYQIILQEFIDERNEVKSGNIYLKDDLMIIEGAIDKHIRFTNGWSLDINLSVSRFDSLNFEVHKFFVDQTCFSFSEIMRLIRLARKIPYTNAIIEFSFFNTGKLYFWEIKKGV
jgi:hypothetical protein